MVITDHHVYQKALASETSEVKKAMIYSTLEKADILRTFETEIGKDFVIEESLNTRKLNDLCWMAKFIRQSKMNYHLRIRLSTAIFLLGLVRRNSRG